MPTTIIAAGRIAMGPNARFVGQTIALGGVAGATLAFLGDASVTGIAPTLDAGSEIESLIAGQAFAEASLVQAAGRFINRGTILANAASGSGFTLLAQPAAGLPGVLVNAGEIDAGLGNALTVVAQSGATVLNTGKIQAQGGSVLLAAEQGGSLALGGLLTLANGGTIELAAPGAPTIVFQDGRADLLRLDQPGLFTGTIAGFGAGDTIDLGRVAVGSLSYGYNGVLTLSNAGSVVARLTLAGGAYPVGSWSVVKGVAGGFLVTTGADGHTRLSTTQAPVTAVGVTAAYGTTSAWTGGSVPAAGRAIVLGAAAAPYAIATGTSVISAGGLLIAGANATFEVDRSIVVGPQSAVIEAGTLAIAKGAALQSSGLVQLTPAAVTRIDPGGGLFLGGPATGPAVAIEGTLLVNGGRIAAGPGQAGRTATGGRTAIGLGDGAQPAVATVQGGGQVSDTGAMLGAGPESSGTLVLTGAGTAWTDLVDTTNQQDTTGAMLVGAPGVAAAGLAASGPATLLIAQGAVLTDAGYAEIGLTAGSPGAATVTGGARWQIGQGANPGALVVGAGGAGTLSILNGGTVSAGTGGTILAGGNPTAMPYGIAIGAGGAGSVVVGSGSLLRASGAIGIGTGGAGALSVVGQGASVITPGLLVLGGGGQGTIAVAGGALAEAGGLQIWQGSTLAVDPGSGIDVGAAGSVVAGAVMVEAGHTLAGNGSVGANLVNNGTVLAAASPAGGLEVAGNISGAGLFALAGGAVAQIDGAVGAGQTIAFGPGGGLLKLLAQATTFAAPVTGLDTGDKIASSRWSQITNVQAVGPHSVLIQTKGGTAVLSNVSFAPDASRAFTWYKDPATGFWTIEVASPGNYWAGAPGGGALDRAGNWLDNQTGAPAASAPGPGTSAMFASGGTLTGTLAALDASFGGLSPWTLAGANLTLTGHPSPPAPPFALGIAESGTMNGATITAHGSAVIGAYGGLRLSLLNVSTLSTVGAAVGAAASQSGAVAVGGGSTWISSQSVAIGDAGTGTLTVNAGTVVTQGGAALGASLHGAGTATVGAGGTWIAGGGLSVGGSGTGGLSVGAGGTLLLSGGETSIGRDAGATGALGIAAGGLVRLTGSAFPGPALAIGDAGSGSVSVSGAGALLDMRAGPIALGVRGGTGALTIANGGTVLAGTPDSRANPAVAIGVAGPGSLSVTGTGARLTASGGLAVGLGGQGTLSIAAGATVCVGFDAAGLGGLAIGVGAAGQPGGSGTASVAAGGALGSLGWIDVGGGGDTGTLSVTGRVDAGGSLVIGTGGGGAGRVTIGAGGVLTLGSLQPLGASLVLGLSGSAGTLAVSGGQVNAGTIVVGAGTGGTGAVTLSGVGAGVTAQTILDGVAGAGTMSVGAGATLAASQAVTIGAAGVLALQSGGVSAAQIANAGQIDGAGSLGAAALVNTGTIDALGGSLGIAGGISGSGTLAIGANGNLLLGGSVAGQTIDFLANTGTLTIQAPAQFGTGTIVGFVAGDRIAVVSATALSQSWDGVSGTLKLTGPGQSVALHVAGPHSAADFTAAVTTITPPGSGSVALTASNTVVQPGPGPHTLVVSGVGNTIVVPKPGLGFLDIFGPMLSATNLLDFSQALSAAGWSGSQATLGQIVQVVPSSGGAAVVWITPTGATSPSPVLRLEGQAGLTLAGLETHALL